MKRLFFIICTFFSIIACTVNVKAEIKDPRTTWDCIWFGSYTREFTRVNLDEYKIYNEVVDQPIKWRILDTDDNKALLLSDEIIDEYHVYEPISDDSYSFYCGPQIDFIWSNSVLRSYMNDFIYNKAFTVKEQNDILESEVISGFTFKEEKDVTSDKLFILSYEQLVNYYGFGSKESLRCKNYKGEYVTYYTLSDGYRSTNIFGDETSKNAFCDAASEAIDDTGAKVKTNALKNNGIRVAMWVDLTKCDYQDAGTVSSNGDVNEIAYEYPINLTMVKIKSAKNVRKKSITIKFKKVKDAKKYRIQYATNKKFKKAKVKTSKKTTIKLKKLKIGKTYYIRIRAVNGTKKGKWSKTKKVKVKF